MKSLLFLIPTLDGGGAEKVLVNLVNNLNPKKYNITVQTLFSGGVHINELKPHVTLIEGKCKPFNGNVLFFKLFSPKFLYKKIIRKKYDVVVAYLEGVASRIISGCPYENTKKYAWIHSEQADLRTVKYSFRSSKEMNYVYNCFDKIVCVAKSVKESFEFYVDLKNESIVLYNTNETGKIKKLKDELVSNELFLDNEINICGVGRLIQIKGFDRLAKIQKRLRDEGYNTHFYILGVGEAKETIEKYLIKNNIADTFTFLGFQKNPYKFISKCDIFVCSSFVEGFSTATTESLIVGIPVVSTDVSGAKEMLGENEYGIVTNKDDESLYMGIKKLLDDSELLKHYKNQAVKRGEFFSLENTVNEVEKLLDA